MIIENIEKANKTIDQIEKMSERPKPKPKPQKCMMLNEIIRAHDGFTKEIEGLKKEVQNIDIPEVDLSNHYTKTESDNKYQPKGDYATTDDLNNIEVVSSWNDLTDKPFYVEEGGEVDILASQELAFADDSGAYTHSLETPIVIEIGKTYKVLWDGTLYECVGKAYVFDENTVKYVGNGALLDQEESSEPFCIAYMETLSFGVIATFDTSTNHTVRIYTSGEIVHKLDMKFIDAYTKEETENLITNAITSALNKEV